MQAQPGRPDLELRVGQVSQPAFPRSDAAAGEETVLFGQGWVEVDFGRGNGEDIGAEGRRDGQDSRGKVVGGDEVAASADGMGNLESLERTG